MDNLWASLSQRVEAELGRPLPKLPPDDPDAPEFLALLNQLRHVHPDLAEAVINAYTGTAEPLPSEVEAAAERRRQRVHRRLLERFVRPDGLRTGRVRVNLRKVINWVVAGAAVFAILWSLVPKSTPVGAPARRVRPPVSRGVTYVNSPSAVSARPSPSPALSFRAPASRPASMLAIQSLTVAPLRGRSPALDGNAPRRISSPSPLLRAVAVTTTPAVVFEANQAPLGSTSPLVYQRESAQERPQHLQITAHVPPDGISATQSPAPVVVYDAGGAQTSPRSPIPALSAAANASTETAASAASRGQLLEGRLVTPVAVTSARGATPALVEIAQGPLQGAVLLGQATRSPEGLVLIQFNALIAKDGKELSFRGAAYDADVGRLGVDGQTSTMLPGAASALLAATMQSISNFFKTRAQPQQVTITNGSLAITQGMPSFWDGLAAAVAQAFPSGAEATTGPTLVTRLERGQPITVLVL